MARQDAIDKISINKNTYENHYLPDPGRVNRIYSGVVEIRFTGFGQQIVNQNNCELSPMANRLFCQVFAARCCGPEG